MFILAKINYYFPIISFNALFLSIMLYALLVCLDSALQNKSLRIGIYSIAASFIQLIGYGTGFWRAWWERCILGRNEFEAFRKNFYK
jgi:hypothetical protein